MASILRGVNFALAEPIPNSYDPGGEMRRLLWLLLSFVSAGVTSTANAELSADCAAFIKNLPKEYKSGFVDVPQDYSNPEESPTLQIFYYWNAANTDTPIVFINGGPLGSSGSSFEHLFFTGHTKLPLLFFDQRGTGCSSKAPSDFVVSDWGTDAIARDMDVIRTKVFGAEKHWKVLGHSYGALIAFRYLTLFPDSLVSVHTYGNAPVRDAIEYTNKKMDGQNRIFTQNYAKQNPGDVDRLQALKVQVPGGICTRVGIETQMCGVKHFDALSSIVSNMTKWDDVHMWIDAMASQYYRPGNVPSPVKLDQTAMVNLVAENVFWQSTQEIPLYDAIYAHEITPGMSATQACSQALSEKPREDELINECRLWKSVMGNFVTDKLATAPPNPVRVETMRDVLRAHPGLQLYAYSGEYDYRIPFELYAEMNEALGGIQNYHYRMAEGTDHTRYAEFAPFWEQLAK